MARTVAIGVQDFETLIINNYFYVDKTMLIKDWWESGDCVTLITRPRRFGKTLNMNMLERFFSVKFEGKGEVFEGLNIWKEEKYRELQGTYPVIFLSFAGVKEDNYEGVVYQICQLIKMLYKEHFYLMETDILTEEEKKEYREMAGNVMPKDVPMSLHILSSYLYRYYGKKVIILLDEYDTPLQEAYLSGYWEKIVTFTRNLFNNTFKTNPYLERAVMTGITYTNKFALQVCAENSTNIGGLAASDGRSITTRVSKESMFSDLNNLRVITMTSDEYAPYFGFTEEEVFAALDEFGMKNKNEVKKWYDGFTVGTIKDIYNPWSIISYLKEGKLNTYWANTSSNGLVSSLLRESDKNIKMQFEELLHNHSIVCEIDEEIVYNQLEQDDNAVWSLLLASGYLTVLNVADEYYDLVITNYETEKMFRKMVRGWFRRDSSNYNGFVKALLCDDVEAMNEYMNMVAVSMFSLFDTGKRPSVRTAPERFYHGFVLGLLVDLSGRYNVTSNRESGFGRYDVMLMPVNKLNGVIKDNHGGEITNNRSNIFINNGMKDDGITNICANAIIIEFKIFNPKKENTLEDTVRAALKQIDEKNYEQAILGMGISKEHIRKYGFAFEGKKVLIG